VPSPKAKEALVVEYDGTNVYISWKTSFEDYGYIITSYRILFSDNGGNYIDIHCVGPLDYFPIILTNCTITAS
jgi:hypothetical protein